MVTQANAKYQTQPKGAAHCAVCNYFLPGASATANGACKQVAGVISPNGWCQFFAKKPGSPDRRASLGQRLPGLALHLLWGRSSPELVPGVQDAASSKVFDRGVLDRLQFKCSGKTSERRSTADR